MHGHNKAFEGDPFSYVNRYAINHLGMKVSGEKDGYDFTDVPKFDKLSRPIPGQYSVYNNQVNQAKKQFELAKHGFFDLEPVSSQGSTAIFLRFVVPGTYAPKVEYGGVQGGDSPIHAYWLGYEMPGLQGSGKANIPFIDLPKAAPAHKLMMTGAMNGCSMVVTLKPNDPLTLRVYHDSVHEKDTFKDDIVVCRIDYVDEGYKSANIKASVIAALNSPNPRAVPQARPCVRTSYGDLEQYRSMESGSGSKVAHHEVKLRTSFNFLYFDSVLSRWVAVSQPLDTLPTVAQPVKAFFETESTFKERQKKFRRGGTSVAVPPSNRPWTSPIPY